MPPVGAKVSAFSVSSERWTASCQVPSYVQRAAHSSQNASVFVSASSGSIGSGVGWLDGNQRRTNGTRSPAATENDPWVRRFRPSCSIGVRRRTASGPAIATSVPSIVRTHGTIEP